MSFKITPLPKYVDTIIFQKEEFYKNSSNLLKIFNDYTKELNINLNYEKGKSSGDFIKSNQDFFKKLNDDKFIIDGKDLDPIFKDYYIEKYNSLFKTIKASVSSFIGNSEYFKQYSDDVGILSDSICILDNSIVPYFDKFDSEIENGIPNNLNSTIYNKVSNNNKILQLNFSRKTDALLKVNLNGLINYDFVGIVKTPHGNNLATDYYYYERLFGYKEQLSQSITKILKGLGDYILFIKNLNLRENVSKSTLFGFKLYAEDIENKVDILKNQIMSNPYTDNNILSS